MENLLKNWSLSELNNDRFPPNLARVGDLKYDAHYSYRGIPFTIKMFRGSDGYYQVWLRVYNTIDDKWRDLAELSGLVNKRRIIYYMSPFADKMIAAGQRFEWKKELTNQD